MLTLLLHMACSGSKNLIEYIELDVEPFELQDVNQNSSTFEQMISSHQFVDSSPELVSAWYFGHST